LALDRKRRIAGSRRAQSERGKRLNSRKQRRLRRNIFIASALILLIITALFLIFPRSSDDGLGQPVPLLTGLHAPPYAYNSSPPTSGNHLDIPSRYGFMDDTLVPEAAVHNMEHGAVVIWYKPNNPKLAGSVNRLIQNLGPRCLVAGIYRGKMTSDIAATVWGRILELDSYDEVKLKNFITEHRGKNGPEAPFCKTESLDPAQMN